MMGGFTETGVNNIPEKTVMDLKSPRYLFQRPGQHGQVWAAPAAPHSAANPGNQAPQLWEIPQQDFTA